MQCCLFMGTLSLCYGISAVLWEPSPCVMGSPLCYGNPPLCYGNPPPVLWDPPVLWEPSPVLWEPSPCVMGTLLLCYGNPPPVLWEPFPCAMGSEPLSVSPSRYLYMILNVFRSLYIKWCTSSCVLPSLLLPSFLPSLQPSY